MVDVAVLTTGSLSLKEFQINRTPLHERRKESPTPEIALVRSVVSEKTEMKYDSTGMFHWVPAQAIEDCTMARPIGLIRFSIFMLLLVAFSGQIQIDKSPERPCGGLSVC